MEETANYVIWDGSTMVHLWVAYNVKQKWPTVVYAISPITANNAYLASIVKLSTCARRALSMCKHVVGTTCKIVKFVLVTRLAANAKKAIISMEQVPVIVVECSDSAPSATPLDASLVWWDIFLLMVVAHLALPQLKIVASVRMGRYASNALLHSNWHRENV